LLVAAGVYDDDKKTGYGDGFGWRADDEGLLKVLQSGDDTDMKLLGKMMQVERWVARVKSTVVF